MERVVPISKQRNLEVVIILISNREILINIFTRIINAKDLKTLIDNYRQMLNKSPNFSVYHLEKVQRFINNIYSTINLPIFFDEDGKLDEEKEKEYEKRLTNNYYFVNLLKTMLIDLYVHSVKRMSYLKEQDESWQTMASAKKK